VSTNYDKFMVVLPSLATRQKDAVLDYYDELRARIAQLEADLKDTQDALAETCEALAVEHAAVEKLEAALRTCPCPRPVSPASDGFGYLTTADCKARGECGCDQGAALQAETKGEGQ
jgi:hypothetical protein